MWQGAVKRLIEKPGRSAEILSHLDLSESCPSNQSEKAKGGSSGPVLAVNHYSRLTGRQSHDSCKLGNKVLTDCHNMNYIIQETLVFLLC